MDLLGLQSGPRQPLTYALTIVPPLGLAYAFPDIFLGALSYAGTYGVMSLFGVLPAVMAWLERYKEDVQEVQDTESASDGGGSNSRSNGSNSSNSRSEQQLLGSCGTGDALSVSSSATSMSGFPSPKAAAAGSGSGSGSVVPASAALRRSSAPDTTVRESPSSQAAVRRVSAPAISDALVPGGKPLLLLVGTLAAGIITNQAYMQLVAAAP